MSLINKMLQDLDARGADGARDDASSAVRPVSYGGRGGLPPSAVIGLGVLALVLLGGGGFAAWKYFRRVAQPGAAPLASRTPLAVPAPQAVRQNGPVAPATADEGPAVVQGGIAPEAHRAAGEQMARQMEERNAAARRAAATDGASAAGTLANAVPVAEQPSAQHEPRKVNMAEKKRLAGHEKSKTAKADAKRAAGAEHAPAALVATEASEAGLNPQQKAENEYRRALAKLQDARIVEAIASLEQAVTIYPRHEAARQTLVGLLLEAGRTQEAARHLIFATSLDPRQANMAMLLARLQLESGGNALETLQRSLPYAESNAEFRAMVAGVLQRANRNKEAIDHYQAAVRLQPENGVWWMGMGISLQAEKRNAEAKVAFQRARDSGRLSPELQTFVERRLQQFD